MKMTIKDKIMIIALILIMIVGVLTVSKRVEDIENGNFIVVSDSEMDK